MGRRGDKFVLALIQLFHLRNVLQHVHGCHYVPPVVSERGCAGKYYLWACAGGRNSYFLVSQSYSFAQSAEDTEVRYPTRKAACKSQAHARALPGFALLAVGEGAKLVLCRSKPAESAGDSAFVRHFSILVLYPGICRPFDPRMPVL